MLSNVLFWIILLTVVIVSSNPIEMTVKNLPYNRTTAKKAEETIMKMNKVCMDPVPKLYQVDKIYPLPNGRYKPHCVILHRCDKDAGCCNLNDEVCAPAEVQTVQIHIFALENRQRKVYEMTFSNHTRCECKKTYELDIEGSPEVHLQ